MGKTNSNTPLIVLIILIVVTLIVGGYLEWYDVSTLNGAHGYTSTVPQVTGGGTSTSATTQVTTASAWG